MNDRTLAGELASSSTATFYSALSHLTNPEAIEAARFLELVARSLDANHTLSDLSKSQRMSALLGHLKVAADDVEQVVLSEPKLSAGLRNALANHLPAIRRRLLVAGRQEDSSSIRELEAAVDSCHNSAEGSCDDATHENALACSTVIALSQQQIQDANRKLLADRNLGMLVWDSVEKLKQDLLENSDVCGFLLDSSVLSGLSLDEQREVFRVVACYSTFVWIRVDQRGLKLDFDEIEEIISHARGASERVSARALSIQPNGAVAASELCHILRAREALRAHTTVALVPGELDEKQAQLLIAASQEYAREIQLSGAVKITSLTTTFIRGGQSGASIAVVRIGADEYPVVAKIADKSRILDEIHRFRMFIQSWDDQLRPKVYLHGNSGVVLFALLRITAGSREPAPTLYDALKDLWDSEIFADEPSEELQHQELYLTNAVQGLASSLGSLNAMSPPPHNFATMTHPGDDSYFQRLESRGITWGLASSHREARGRAAFQYSTLHGKGRVHGDLHLRNVLVRGSQDVHLIDYAASGPGHPAVDLVRLELALYLGFARPLIPEEECVRFQQLLSIERLSKDDLMSEFPALHACRINRVSIAGCVAARDQAIVVVDRHGGAIDDYIAVKYLVAWQSLLQIDRQTSTARSVITALAPVINTWRAAAVDPKRAIELDIAISPLQAQSLLLASR
jgi:hypothetical protein